MKFLRRRPAPLCGIMKYARHGIGSPAGISVSLTRSYHAFLTRFPYSNTLFRCFHDTANRMITISDNHEVMRFFRGAAFYYAFLLLR
jgi:hypothetical protein